MIHVATVHWRDDRWVDVQLRHLERNLPKPYRVYAFLNGLPADHSEKFFYASSEPVKDHAIKLGLLGDLISFAAEPGDPLLFVDGDAFPIAPVEPLIAGELEQRRLVAARRSELGDPQPHPCFCLTTVGFWRELATDWHRGRKWRNSAGKRVSDVGGKLYGKLERLEVDWLPLDRTNKRDLHPLYFAIYGDLVYHHGGGFRAARGGRLLNAERGLEAARRSRRARVLDALPRNRLTKRLRRRYHPARRIARELREETAELSREVFARIERDDEFWREFV